MSRKSGAGYKSQNTSAWQPIADIPGGYSAVHVLVLDILATLSLNANSALAWRQRRAVAMEN